MTPDAFWDRVQKSNDCWEWTGSRRSTGYGSVTLANSPFDLGIQVTTAHRFAFMLEVGPIPDGYQVDHVCKNRSCVRPEHLEAVTPRENNARSTSPSALNAQKENCHQGHPLSGDNLIIRAQGERGCKACKLARQRERRAVERAASSGPGSGCHQRERTACPHGHPYDEENTYMDKSGRRHCRECGRTRRRIASLEGKA